MTMQVSKVYNIQYNDGLFLTYYTACFIPQFNQ